MGLLAGRHDERIIAIETAFYRGDEMAASKLVERRNLAVVCKALREIGEDNYEGFRDLLQEDVQLEILGGPNCPLHGVWRGRDEVYAVARDQFSRAKERRPEVEAVTAQGGKVVLQGREQGFLAPEGVPYDFEVFEAFTVRSEKISSYRIMYVPH